VTAGKCQVRIKKCETSGVGLWRRAGEGHFWEAGSLTAAILKSEIGSHPEHRAAPIAGCREGRQSPSEPYLPCQGRSISSCALQAIDMLSTIQLKLG